MLHWWKLKYISWNWGILSETKILCLRLRYFVWDEDTLSETYKLLLPLQFHSIYSFSPCTLFSPAINFFPHPCLLNSLAIHFVTLALPPIAEVSISIDCMSQFCTYLLYPLQPSPFTAFDCHLYVTKCLKFKLLAFKTFTAGRQKYLDTVKKSVPYTADNRYKLRDDNTFIKLDKL